MPRGDKSKYTDKQERKADHIAQSYEGKGVPEHEAERRAWATVNKGDGGGKRAGSGRGAHTGRSAAYKDGAVGERAATSRSASARSASAKKAADVRKRHIEH
jgi:plasmid stabilization system protein ParE